MNDSSPKLIGNLINSVLHQLGLDKKIKQFEIVDLWSNIVGEQISKVTKAETIKDGKLYVSVEHPTWRNELLYLKKELIDKINKEMKQEIVKDIIFR
jgi:predicted nucleic acid-binding Zn ribbon protein